MDFDAGLLLFLFIFFVLPLIQRALGGAKQTPPQGRPEGQRRPGVPPERPEGRARLPEESRTVPAGRTDAGASARTESERAADLVPDDLWEILTGERQSRAPSQREREPEREVEAEWGRDAEDVWQPEETLTHAPESDEQALNQRLKRLEALQRREHGEAARTTTTTTPTPTPIAARERASPPPAPKPSPYAIADVAAQPPSHARPASSGVRRRRTAPSLANRSNLKRAFVLREVLGPPKALE